MSPVNTGSRRRIFPDVAIILVAVTMLALATGHPGVAEMIGGAVIVWTAIVAGSSVAPKVVAERKPGRELLWDLLLVAVVLFGLVGVGVMALAIP